MFTPQLIALLGSPTSNISGDSVKFFCRLVMEMDLTKPRSLNVQFLMRRFNLDYVGCEVARVCVKELREAGVLKEYARVRDGAKGALYMVDPKWWASLKTTSSLAERSAQEGSAHSSSPPRLREA